MRRLNIAGLCLLAAGFFTTGCGDQSATYAFQKLTVTQIQQVNAPMLINCVGVVPEPVTITGGDFRGTIGTRVEVRWGTKSPINNLLPGPRILHDGERDFASTTGLVTSATTILTVSPQLDIPCNMVFPANVDGCVQVFLQSNAHSDPFIMPGLFKIPGAGAGGWVLNIATAPACDQTPFTLTAANLTPIGGSVNVHWIDTSMGNSFEGLNEITTVATITSATTIEGLTPIVVLCGMNGTSDIIANIDRVEWVNEPICIPIMPPLALTFEAPDLTALAFTEVNLPAGTYTAAYAAGEVPSTFLENPDAASLAKFTTTEGFTITGTGFGPIGGSALVTFTDLGGATVFDGSGAAAVTVPGLVLNATTITGRLPGINQAANRLLADVATQVQVDFSTGCCVFQPAFASFTAPPTINAIANLTAGTAGGLNDGFMTQAIPTDFYGCHSQQVQLTGVNFDAAPIGIRVYDVTVGPVAGRHGTANPGPLAVDTDLRAPTIAAAMIDGFTRLEPRIAAWDTNNDGLVPTEFRVTNVDGQCTTIRANYQHFGRQVNRSNNGATINSNVSVAIDPTSMTGGANAPPTPEDFGASTNDAVFGGNLAVAFENDASDQGVSNSFGGTTLFLDRSLDGGVTWARTTVDGVRDGFPAAAIRSFPQVAYDAFGNLHLTYLVDDFVGGESHIQVLTSFDQGATFGAGGTAYSTAGGGVGLIDRPNMAVGPSGAGQAVLVSWVDGSTGVVPDEVRSRAVTFGSFGVLGLLLSAVRVDTAPIVPGVFFRTHAVPAIGPGGEFYVSWVEPDFTLFPPVSDIRINVDADGVGAGAVYGIDQIVAANVEFPLAAPPSQPDVGRLIPLQSMKVIQAGAHAGRVIVAHEGTVLSGFPVALNPTFLHVIATYSDDFGASWNANVVHQVDTADQFLPTLATDPIQGHVYISYHDTRASAPVNNTSQRFAASSTDGATWGSPLLISDGASAHAPADEERIEYGLWAGMAVWDRCILAGWADTADNAAESDAVARLFQMKVGGN